MSYVCKKHDEFVPDGQQCRWCEPAEDAALQKVGILVDPAAAPGEYRFAFDPALPGADQTTFLDLARELNRRYPIMPIIEDLPWSGVGPMTSEEIRQRREERMLGLGRVLAPRPAPPLASGVYLCPRCGRTNEAWEVHSVTSGTLLDAIRGLLEGAEQAHDKVCPGLIQAKGGE